MRTLLFSMIFGFVVGVILAPFGSANATCPSLSRDAEADSTCCGCTNEDWSDDRVTNNETTSELISVLGVRSTNISAWQYLPSQTQTIPGEGNRLYSTGGERTTHCSDLSEFDVDVYSGSEQCIGSGSYYDYGFFENCCD